ncbi:MAG: hypothetical protein CM15mP33_09760 [Candidatus Neomarinimicrobiota bacterium]|nr:MAG: hypothetical protein CM15mP33_09760 [Candidatus Neomarinimicrobiota bacterium]
MTEHQEMVAKMLKDGTAYKCFLQKEELDNLKKESEQRKEIFVYLKHLGIYLLKKKKH